MGGGPYPAPVDKEERDRLHLGWKGWPGRRFHHGDKEIFCAEAYAIYQAFRLHKTRNKSDTSYTVFSDSAEAISRVQADQVGPGQTFARSIIEITGRLGTRGNTVTL